MKKNIIKIFVVVFLAVTLITIGSINQASAKVIKITLPAHIPPSYVDLYTGFQRFADRVNELGKGKVQIDLYHSQSLYKSKEIVPALMNGSAEMILHTNTHTTGSWPEAGGLSLPFLYEDEFDAKNKWSIGGELLSLVNEEMGKKYGVKIIAPGIMTGFIMATREKKVSKVEDIKGMKIRATGVPDAALAQVNGASTTYISSSEMYEALQRGTVDGMITYPGTIYARRLNEVLKYLVNFKPMLCAWGYQIYVLNKTWDSWPKDVQNIILTAAYEYDYRYLYDGLKYYNNKILPNLRKNMKIIQPTPEEMIRFKDSAKKVHQDWLDKVDKDFGKKFMELSKGTVKK